MKKILQTINELHFNQPREYGLIKAHSDLPSDKNLRSLWIEIPPHCHLCCSYCYTNADRRKEKDSSSNLTVTEYKDLLEDFKKAGGKYIGIPGEGEPFHPRNRELVKEIIKKADSLDIETTIFTTGETIFYPIADYKNYKDIVMGEPENQLAEFLKEKKVIILVKFNSRKPEIQDRLVGMPGYTKARERAMDLLINEYGFNRDKRIGFVTSIIEENQDEITEIYEYAKENNLIFDCDTILPQGRGYSYLKKANITEVKLHQIFDDLDDRGAIHTKPTGTYVGVACDRVKHHLYVDKKGNVYPCVGCTKPEDRHKLKLGNIRDNNKINDIWKSPIRKALREDLDQVISGVCSVCENFLTKQCYSCLGRAVKKFTVGDEENRILIDTHGCFNHVPEFANWINSAVEYLRQELSKETVVNNLQSDFENLWMPAQGTFFNLPRLSPIVWKDKVESLSKSINSPAGGDTAGECSLKKDYNLSDLSFTLNKVWDFFPGPVKSVDNAEFNTLEFDKRENCSTELLPNVILPLVKIFLSKFDSLYSSGNISFFNFMFYDPLREKPFYRLFTRTGSESEPGKFKDNNILLRGRKITLLHRWAEYFEDRNYVDDYLYDLSQVFREKIYEDYELILNEYPNSPLPKSRVSITKKRNIIDISPLFKVAMINKKIDKLSDKVNEWATKKWDKVSDMSLVVFKNLDENASINYRRMCSELSEAAFYRQGEAERLSENYWPQLRHHLLNVIKGNISCVENDKFVDSMDENESWSQVLHLLKKILSERENTVGECKENSSVAAFLELLALFDPDNELDEEFTWVRIVNYFIWLGYMHRHLGINRYYVLHATNFSQIDPESPRSKIGGVFKNKATAPSGIVIGCRQQISIAAKSNLKLLFNNLLRPIDEIYNMMSIEGVSRSVLFDQVAHEFKNTDSNKIIKIYEQLVQFLEDDACKELWDKKIREAKIDPLSFPLPRKGDSYHLKYLLLYITMFASKKLKEDILNNTQDLNEFIKVPLFQELLIMQAKKRSEDCVDYLSLIPYLFKHSFCFDTGVSIKSHSDEEWNIRYKQISLLIVAIGNALKHTLSSLGKFSGDVKESAKNNGEESDFFKELLEYLENSGDNEKEWLMRNIFKCSISDDGRFEIENINKDKVTKRGRRSDPGTGSFSLINYLLASLNSHCSISKEDLESEKWEYDNEKKCPDFLKKLLKSRGRPVYKTKMTICLPFIRGDRNE